MSADMKICSSCKNEKSLDKFEKRDESGFVLKTYKCCNQCREFSKNKYTKVDFKQRPTTYNKNQKLDFNTLYENPDMEIKCPSCHHTLLSENFIDVEHKRVYKCCHSCRVKHRKHKDLDVPRERKYCKCEVCDREIVDYMFPSHLKSKLHKYNQTKKGVCESVDSCVVCE